MQQGLKCRVGSPLPKRRVILADNKVPAAASAKQAAQGNEGHRHSQSKWASGKENNMQVWMLSSKYVSGFEVELQPASQIWMN